MDQQDLDQMNTTTCTPLCERVKNLEPRDGKCLPHSDLVERLGLSSEDREKGYQLGTYAELLQRRQCSFCQLLLNAVVQNTNETCKSEQLLGVQLFAGEQSFRLTYPSRLGTRLAFVANDASLASGPDNARLRKHGDQGILVKSWLNACSTHHPDCCLEPVDGNLSGRFKHPACHFNESATSNFRLIDVEKGCIKHAALDERYIALSYIWGSLPMLMLDKENYNELLIEGSLELIRSRLPKTINDVIDFVSMIGERYLWVDGLCLVQDDHEDVLLGIQMMNSIYHGAYCTIAAASGESANAGLITSDMPQATEEIAPGLNMTIQHSIDWYLKRSDYNTRGWTLQELVLSRRTILFINGQIHFRCRSANWSEDTWADRWLTWRDPDDSNITRIPGLVDGRLAHLWPYQKLCEDFSRRKLSRDGDSLRATAGITRTLAAGMQTCLVEGLSGYYLDHFLLFISTNGNLERKPEFGSFSWAGWRGRIMWPRENFAWYNEKTERTWEIDNILKYFEHNRVVTWSSIDRKTTCESLSSTLYSTTDRNAPSPLLRFIREYPSVFPNPDTDPVRENTDPRWYSVNSFHGDRPNWGYRYADDSSSGRLERDMKKYKTAFTVKAADHLNSQAELDRMVQHIESPYEILEFTNWQVMRNIFVGQAHEERSRFGPRSLRENSDVEQFEFREPLHMAKQKEDKRREKADVRGTPYQVPNFPTYDVLQCKTISFRLNLGAQPTRKRQSTSPFDRVAGVPLLDKSGQIVGSLHPDNFGLLGQEGSSVELIVITKCFEPTVGSTLLELEGQGPLPWNLLWVMWIVWQQGIAERYGVGQVFASALEGAAGGKPVVKQILLG